MRVFTTLESSNAGLQPCHASSTPEISGNATHPGYQPNLTTRTPCGPHTLQVLTQKWEVIAWLLAGLVATKTAVIASLGRAFGLTNNESIRIGLILSQGGEFAFVILSLASQLKVLPENLNQVRGKAEGVGIK